MPIIKRIAWSLAAIFALAAVAAMVLYLIASRVPSGYSPAQLTQAAKEQVVVKQFARRVMDFSNEAQRGQPFEWRATQEQLNEYLASMDEIAAVLPSGKAGQVYQEMNSLGLAGPAVELADGTLTLMCRWRDFNKVVSVELAFSFTADRRIQIKLTGVRLGQLPIPAAIVRSKLDVLKRRLGELPGKLRAKQGTSTNSAARRVSSDDMAILLATVIAAIDEAPVPSEIRKYNMRLDEIRLSKGQISVHFSPLGQRN